MKVKSRNVLYFLMIFFACGSYMLSHSTIPNAYDSTINIIHIFDYVSYALGVWLIAMNRRPKKYFITCAMIAIVLLLSALLSRDVILLKGFIIILASSRIENSKIIKDYIVVILLFSTLIITLCISKRIEDVTEVRYVSGTIRRSFGFSHPNRFGYLLILVSLALMYYRYKKYKIYDLIFNVVLAAFSFAILNNRTAVIMLALICCFEWYFMIWANKPKKWIKTVSKIALVVGPLLSIYITIAYNASNFIHLALNEIITGRLYLGNAAYKVYGFSLLGQNVEMNMALEATRTRTQVLAIDNFYAYIAIHFGIIILAIGIYVLYELTNKTVANTNNDILLVWVFLIIIYGLFENQIVDLRVDFPLVILLGALIKKSSLFNRDARIYELKKAHRKQVSFRVRR